VPQNTTLRLRFPFAKKDTACVGALTGIYHYPI